MADAIQWDLRALDHLLANSRELRGHLEDLGDHGVAFGEANSPDAAPLRAGYIDSWVWTVGHDRRTGAPVLAIANTDWKAWWIEKGTAPHSTASGHHRTRYVGPAPSGAPVSMPAHHVLDRTLDHIRR